MIDYAGEALKVAMVAHAGQVDKAGKEYILHPIAVANTMTNDIDKAVAYLHDVVEDTNTTLNDIGRLFPREIVNAIEAITRKKDEDYEEYLFRLSHNDIAVRVKIADIVHNSDISRFDKPKAQEIKRCEKYKRKIILLKRMIDQSALK